MRGAHSGEMGGKGDRRGRKMGNTEEIETGDPRERIGKRGEVIGDHRERKGGQVTEGGDNKVQEHLSTGLLNRSLVEVQLLKKMKTELLSQTNRTLPCLGNWLPRRTLTREWC